LRTTKEVPERPLFYHLIEDFERQMGRRPFSERVKDAETIAVYEHALIEKINAEDRSGIIFSVIVRESTADEKSFGQCFRSLVEQKFPARAFEILVISSRPFEENTDGDLPTVRRISRSEGESEYACLARTIDAAEGQYVCFTESDCIVPSDWLLNFYLVYGQNSDIGGAGGYAVEQPDAHTVFDHYSHFELARRLNLEKEPRYLAKLFPLKNNLFYQNPAGTLKNMSYKKQVVQIALAEYPEISESGIGEALKNSVIKKHQIYFAPSRVYSSERTRLRSFVRKNLERGLSAYSLCALDPELKRYLKKPVVSLVTRPIESFASANGSPRFAAVVFIAEFFQLIGWWYGGLARFSSYLESKMR